MAIDFTDDATELLLELGVPASKKYFALERVTEGERNPYTGEWTAEPSEEVIYLTAAKVRANKEHHQEFTFMTGDLVGILDSAVEPLPSDVFLAGSERFTIIAIAPVDSGAEAQIYKLQLRSQ